MSHPPPAPLLPPPTLTYELFELILTLTLRHTQQSTPVFVDPDPLMTAPLNVLSRTIVRSPTSAALVLMPFMPLERPARLGDVALMDAMAQLVQAPSAQRPLTYSSGAPNFLSAAAAPGHLAVIEWWFANKAKLGLFVDTSHVPLEATRVGRVEILEWWQARELPVRARCAPDLWMHASSGGHVAVLQFWLEYGLAGEYDNTALDLASERGHVRVLEWWQSSGMRLEYSQLALAGAIKNKHHDVLEWWSRSGLRLFADESELTLSAISNSDFRALEFLDAQGLLLVKPNMLARLFAANDDACVAYCMDRFRLVPKYMEPQADLFEALSRLGHADALKLVVDYGFKVPVREHQLEVSLEASAQIGSTETLEWWTQQPLGYLRLKAHFNHAVEAAAAGGHVHVLDWMVAGFHYSFDDTVAIRAMHKAAEAGRFHALRWLTATHTKLILPWSIFTAAVTNGQDAIVGWWFTSKDRVPPPLEDSSHQSVFIEAAKEGHFNIIKRWYMAIPHRIRAQFALTLPFVKEVLLVGCSSANLQLVQWWVCVNGVGDPKWIADASYKASEAGSLDILNWFFEMNLFDVTIDHYGLHAALCAGNVQVVEWWNRHVLEYNFQVPFCSPLGQQRFIDSSNPLAALQSCAWLINDGLRFGDELPLEVLRVGNAALIHRLLSRRIFQLPNRCSIFDQASALGHVCILQWWKQARLRDLGLTFLSRTHTRRALKGASRGGFVPVLEWWIASGRPLEISYRSVAQVRDRVPRLDSDIVDWWARSGLLPEHNMDGDDDVDTSDDDDDGGESDGGQGSGVDEEDEEDNDDPSDSDSSTGSSSSD